MTSSAQAHTDTDMSSIINTDKLLLLLPLSAFLPIFQGITPGWAGSNIGLPKNVWGWLVQDFYRPGTRFTKIRKSNVTNFVTINKKLTKN